MSIEQVRDVGRPQTTYVESTALENPGCLHEDKDDFAENVFGRERKNTLVFSFDGV